MPREYLETMLQSLVKRCSMKQLRILYAFACGLLEGAATNPDKQNTNTEVFQ